MRLTESIEWIETELDFRPALSKSAGLWTVELRYGQGVDMYVRGTGETMADAIKSAKKEWDKFQLYIRKPSY